MIEHPSQLRLPFAIDASALKREALAFDEASWQPHFNRGIYRGDWSGIALRTNASANVPLYPDPNSQLPFIETPAMDRCPSVAALLGQLDCAYSGVRLLRLGPGSEILEHRDYDLRFDTGEARLHVSVQSDENVYFFLDRQRVDMKEGECWYIDVARSHSVRNDGNQARIHLVVDCFINDWLSNLLQNGVANE